MEMAIAGWKFFVLSPSFAIHWGFHYAGYQDEHRVKEVANNRFLFKGYMEEKIKQYSAKQDNGLTKKLDYQLKKALERTKHFIFMDEKQAAANKRMLKSLGKANRRDHPRWTKDRWNNFIMKRKLALSSSTRKPLEYKVDKLSKHVKV